MDRTRMSKLPNHLITQSPSSRVALHRFSVLTTIVTFLLLIAGSLVTSNDAGLAVPDWPLSYGTWFPPMVGGIVYEHGHRVIAGLVGLMILMLTVWLWRSEPRRWVRRLGYAALAAVMAQALLGGLTVLLLLPPQISIAHACLGQIVFCLMSSLALATAPHWSRQVAQREPMPRGIQWLGTGLAGLAAIQVLLGAIIRHREHAVVPHMVGAMACVAATGWFVGCFAPHRRSLPWVWAHALRLLALLGLQIGIGVSVYLHRSHVLLRTGHVAIGTLVLAQAVVLAWELLRWTEPLVLSRAWGQRLRDYVELTKPRLSTLVLVTTGVGFWLGMQTASQAWQLPATLLGTALVVAGANALNEWMERVPDGLMQRTKHRPLPAGRLSPRAAYRFGLLLSAVGLTLLTALAHPLSAAIAALSWMSYVLVYTPLKRRTVLCTLVGAIPGALPVMIGWTAARGTLDIEAWALFGIVFLWQLPHFLALAILYREDYARAGFRLLPLIDPNSAMTARQVLGYGLALLPVSLFPAFLGLTGVSYVYGALGLGLVFLAIAARAAWQRSPQSARSLFRASLAYLPMLLVLLAWDKSPSVRVPSCCTSVDTEHATIPTP